MQRPAQMLHVVKCDNTALFYCQRGVVHIEARSSADIENKLAPIGNFKFCSADDACSAVDRAFKNNFAWADAEGRIARESSVLVVERIEWLRLAGARRDSHCSIGQDSHQICAVSACGIDGLSEGSVECQRTSRHVRKCRCRELHRHIERHVARWCEVGVGDCNLCLIVTTIKYICRLDGRKRNRARRNHTLYRYGRTRNTGTIGKHHRIA